MYISGTMGWILFEKDRSGILVALGDVWDGCQSGAAENFRMADLTLAGLDQLFNI